MNFPQQKTAGENEQNHKNSNSPLTTGEVPNFHFDRAHFRNVYFRQDHLPSVVFGGFPSRPATPLSSVDYHQ
jgi:hypothetical protein